MADHSYYMRLALLEAHRSPPRPTNFRVGALLLDPATGALLARGFTLELPGNTHAEQVCLRKVAAAAGLPEEQAGEALPEGTVLYTTMEPCNERLSGALPCVDRILGTGGRIGKVCVGVLEPEVFVKGNSGRRRLEEAGVECVLVPGFEEEILEVAKAGHEKEEGKS